MSSTTNPPSVSSTPTPTATGNKWLQGKTPLATARTISEASSFFANVKKADRSKLSVSELTKFKTKAESSIENKFDLMENSSAKDIDSLTEVYKISIRIEEFSQSLRSYDMAGIFTIPSEFELNSSDSTYHPKDDANAVNLFNQFRVVNLETVMRFSEWVSRYGDDSDMQDLIWSGNKVLNSCSITLQEKIEESVMNMEPHHKTGPIYFKLMMDLILSSTPVSMRAAIRRLENLTLKEFKDESVMPAVSLIRGAVAMMDNNEATPSDIHEIVLRLMKTSSTDEFNTYVTTLGTARELGIKEMTLEQMLLKIQNKYKELVDNENWSFGTNDEAVFNTNVTCWNCNKSGHVARDCPEERKRDQYGRDWTYGRGRGRARGGRGRGGRGRNLFRIPPTQGASNVRKRGETTEYWCGACGVWGSHLTKDHTSAMSLACTDIQEFPIEDASTPNNNFDSIAPGATPTNGSSVTTSNNSSRTKFAGLLQDFY